MVTKRRKNKKALQNKFFPIIFAFLILGLTALLIYSNFKINQRRSELIAQIKNLQKEIQILEEKNTQFRTGISQVTKESYAEGEIREQGFVREGEKQVVIVPPENEGGVEEKEEKNFWSPQRWWEWIKSKMRD